MNLTLPMLPNNVRILKEEESKRLQSQFTDLPKSLSQCVTCRGTKTFRWYADYGHTDEIADYDCPCSDQFVLHRYLLNAGIGKRGARFFWADAVDVAEDNLKWLMDYLDNLDYYIANGVGLILHGNHGVGKTLLSTLVSKMALERGVESYFTTFSAFLDNYTAGWRSPELAEWFNTRVRNAPLLIMDDVGREYKGRIEVAASALDSVYRERVQNALPSIITTNLAMSEFKRLYSTGVMSMVTESSRNAEFDGEDWRPKQMQRLEFELANRLTRPITLG